MKSAEYWAKRQAANMVAQMQTAEEAAQEIATVYAEANRVINGDMKGIFDRYARVNGMSEAEAKTALNRLIKTPGDIGALKQAVDAMPAGDHKTALLKWAQSSATQARLGRLGRLQKSISGLMQKLAGRVTSIMGKALGQIAQDSYLKGMYHLQSGAGFAFEVKTIPKRDFERIVKERWSGANFSARVWSNTDDLAKALRKELMVSFLTGRSLSDTARIIEKQFDVENWKARRLIRTEASYVTNQLALKAYEDAGIERYIYVAILDLKTSEVCRELDGKAFKVKDAKPGVNLPPLHPWCRSTTIAYISPQVLAKMKRRARDPVAGKNYTIPANMTYKEWYKKYVAPSTSADKTKKKTGNNKAGGAS